MPGQFNPMNPAGGLGPGQGYLSRGLNHAAPGGGVAGADYQPQAGTDYPRGASATMAPPTADYTAAMRSYRAAQAPTAPQGGPSGAVMPGARAPAGPPRTMFSMGGSPVDQPGRTMPATRLYAQAQEAAPGAAAQVGNTDPARLQGNAGAVPGGTGPKPSGSMPPGGGTWADYGFVQQPDGSWVFPNAPAGAPGGGSFVTPTVPGTTFGGGTGGGGGGSPPPVGTAAPNELPTGGVGPGAIWNPVTKSWERNIVAGGSNFEQALRASGSPFAGDPFKLPGKPDAMYAGLESYRNLADEQYGRSAESEALWAQLMQEMGNEPGITGARKVAGDIAADPYTTSSDAMRDRLERRGLEEIETGRNISRNRMADLGITSGPSGTEAVLGTEGAANRQRTDYLMSLDDEFAKRKAADQAAAMKNLGEYGDIYQQAKVAPTAAMAGMKRAPLEQYRETLADLYTQLGTFQSEEALANKNPSTMDYLAGILGPIAGGAAEGLSLKLAS